LQSTPPPQIFHLCRHNNNTIKTHTEKPKLKKINIKTLRTKLKPVIEDELARLCQENKCLQLVQKHMTRRWAVIKRAKIMQHQIEQVRATQVELQQTIEALRQQEHEPSIQEPSPQHPSLQQFSSQQPQ
jgi:hypothetical protein